MSSESILYTYHVDAPCVKTISRPEVLLKLTGRGWGERVGEEHSSGCFRKYKVSSTLFVFQTRMSRKEFVFEWAD